VLVRVISRRALREFWGEHPDAKGPLAAWFTEVKKAKWTDTAEIRRRYPSASFVGNDRIVFNIKGNKYRLIVRYHPPIVFIRFVGTHAEYDRVDAAKV